MLFNTYKPWKFAFSQDTEDLEKVKSDKWGIIGVPFDSTSSYIPGSRFGPTTVREASYSFEKYNLTFDCEIDSVFYDLGDLNVIDGNCRKTCKILEDTVNELVANKIKPLIIGGEHSISLAPIKALANEYGANNIHIIHLDAHMDIIDEYQGETCSHATVMKRIHDLNPKQIVQIGIRSGSKIEKEFVEKNENITTFTAEDTKNKFETIENQLSSIENNEPVYLSIDMDVLDPLFAPGVGNPVPVGISPNKIEKLFKILSKKNVIGFDLVEVATNKLGDITAVTAAKIIYDFLSLVK